MFDYQIRWWSGGTSGMIVVPPNEKMRENFDFPLNRDAHLLIYTKWKPPIPSPKDNCNTIFGSFLKSFSATNVDAISCGEYYFRIIDEGIMTHTEQTNPFRFIDILIVWVTSNIFREIVWIEF